MDVRLYTYDDGDAVCLTGDGRGTALRYYTPTMRSLLGFTPSRLPVIPMQATFWWLPSSKVARHSWLTIDVGMAMVVLWT